jgi:3,4-dihydroxy 2-butanone 4-phosphate synthase/GTP cyclohydrolase II
VTVAEHPAVQRLAEAKLPTEHGTFRALAYGADADDVTHMAIVCGDVAGATDPVLVRVHSECLTGDVFASRRCDCGPQLHAALAMIAAEGCGVVVYLRGHEGRGIGLAHKLQAYALQDEGLDTVDANVELGLPVDDRDYAVAGAILHDLGVERIRLLTNNPQKTSGLAGEGIEVTARVPLVTAVHEDNAAYLRTKRDRMGHLYDID